MSVVLILENSVLYEKQADILSSVWLWQCRHPEGLHRPCTKGRGLHQHLKKIRLMPQGYLVLQILRPLAGHLFVLTNQNYPSPHSTRVYKELCQRTLFEVVLSRPAVAAGLGCYLRLLPGTPLWTGHCPSVSPGIEWGLTPALVSGPLGTLEWEFSFVWVRMYTLWLIFFKECALVLRDHVVIHSQLIPDPVINFGQLKWQVNLI